MIRLRTLLLLGLPSAALGQLPGTRMTVTVTVNQIVMRGDTAQVSYTLSNGSPSQDSLFMFIVDAPARVKTIPRPQPDSEWIVDSLVHSNEPAAFWSDLRLLAPSAVTPALTFESVASRGGHQLGDRPLAPQDLLRR